MKRLLQCYACVFATLPPYIAMTARRAFAVIARRVRRGGDHMLLDNSTDPAALCSCAGSPFPNTTAASPLGIVARVAAESDRLMVESRTHLRAKRQ